MGDGRVSVDSGLRCGDYRNRLFSMVFELFFSASVV